MKNVLTEEFKSDKDLQIEVLVNLVKEFAPEQIDKLISDWYNDEKRYAKEEKDQGPNPARNHRRD